MPDCETGRQVANKARKPKHQQITNLKALTKVQESQVTIEALGEYQWRINRYCDKDYNNSKYRLELKYNHNKYIV